MLIVDNPGKSVWIVKAKLLNPVFRSIAPQTDLSMVRIEANYLYWQKAIVM